MRDRRGPQHPPSSARARTCTGSPAQEIYGCQRSSSSARVYVCIERHHLALVIMRCETQ